jgi:uncharacterized protein YjbJ (UPF0337 family)
MIPNLEEKAMKDKIVGKVEEIRGRLTGDRGLVMKGKGRQMVGEAKRVGKEVAYDAEHADRRRTSDPARPPER